MSALRVVFSATILLGLFSVQSSFAQSEWSLAKDAEGIKVYVRDIQGSPLREFRGETQLKASPENVVKVLRDADAFRKWMPDVVVSELLKATDSEQYHYLDNKAPWPVSNRDGVYHFTYSKASDGTITVRVEAVPNYVPLREGKVRIPQADGQWKLAPNPDGVIVTYQLHASPGGSIPNWLANQTVVDTPFGTLKALRNYLQGTR